MADVHRRAAASGPRLTPEEVTSRGFASAFRGVSETEVRNFLRRVADDIAASRTREAELAARIESLQEQLSNPDPVTEQQLLTSLGEETARVLRSAQDAAEEIRKRAEERAAQLVREAQETSSAQRDEAEQFARTRSESAEQKATEVEQAAEARAASLLEGAEREATELRERTGNELNELREGATATAESEIANAQETGRTLVEDARTVRERVLSDLGRRRSLLQAQVDELRSGRDRLLDAYRVVKRTLSDATDALAQVEARANAELSAPPARINVPPVEGEVEILGGGPGSATPPGVEADATGAAEAANEIDLEAETETDAETESVVVLVDDQPDTGPSRPGTPDAEDSGAAVDALFARLRASHTADPSPGLPIEEPPAPAGAAGTDAPDAPAAVESDPLQVPEPTATAAVEEPATNGSGVAPDAATKPEPKPGPTPEPSGMEELTPDDALRAVRAELLAPLSHDLTRRAKRALQDQQNEVLDKIRTIKGRVDSTAVLPDEAAQQSTWEAVLFEPLAGAYAGAYASIVDTDRPAPTPPDSLVADLAKVMVEPWRERLVSAIDGSADDPDAVTQRLGARYREYRGKDLDRALGDALASAWAHGAYDAVPDGTRLRWVPVEVGRCPDCDDNALEPTIRSEPFPTGALFPPAHPGCRCFLALAEPVSTS